MSLSEYQPAFLSLEQQGDAVVVRVMRSQLSEEDNIQQMAQELITLIDHYQCQQLALEGRCFCSEAKAAAENQ